MPSPRILLEELLVSYLEFRSLYLVESTLRQEKRYLQRFFRFLKTHRVTEVQAIDKVHLDRFQRTLSETPGLGGGLVSSSYLQQSRLCVRGFLVWAHDHGFLLLDFSDLAIPKRNDGVVRVPTANDMKRLLAVPETDCPRDLAGRLILELLYGLGLRAGECARLNLHDADLSAQTLRVVGKGGHQRLLPLSSSVLSILLRYLEHARPVLVADISEKALLVSAYTGERLTGPLIGYRVKNYGAEIGLKVSPHQLRHACATHLLEGGAEIPHIARLLGHQNLETTQRYARVRPIELCREHRRCHPRALGGLDD